MSSQFGFIDIILLAMFAGFIILRLRNILGRKTGHQGKPMNRYFPKGMEVLKDIENNEAIKTGDVGEEEKKQFLKGANVAYEQIIVSLAKGDKKALKVLLGKDLFTDFPEWPVFLPNMFLNLKIIKPANIANKIISIYPSWLVMRFFDYNT